MFRRTLFEQNRHRAIVAELHIHHGGEDAGLHCHPEGAEPPHELLEESNLEDCLDAMTLEKWEQSRYTKQLPGPQCEHKGKPVYRVKSTTRFNNWWYDYHVSDIDQHTFSVYRTVYFKDGEKIKTVVVDWQSLEQPDPRINYPR